MHIEYFKIFSDLVEKKSFSEAAKVNDITQSAVSQQLRTMEKHFNVLIVDRSQKQFRLTQEGEKIYKDSQEILRLYLLLGEELSNLEKEVSGTINVSTTFSIGLHIIPEYVKKFIKLFPAVNVRLDYNRNASVYDDILTNNADLGFVAYPQANKLLETIIFKEENLVLICNPENKLAKRKKIQIHDISGQSLVSYESQSPSHKKIMNILKSHKVNVDVSSQFDNIEMIKHAVEVNLGCAILPISAVENESVSRNYKIIKFNGNPFTRTLAIIYRKGKIQSSSVKKFIEILNFNK
jgi:DNA-binding transcriptional LysR family regulator